MKEERLKPGDYGYGDGYWKVMIETDLGKELSYTIHDSGKVRTRVAQYMSGGIWETVEDGMNFYPPARIVQIRVRKDDDATA